VKFLLILTWVALSGVIGFVLCPAQQHISVLYGANIGLAIFIALAFLWTINTAKQP